jgi:hypothetical protein
VLHVPRQTWLPFEQSWRQHWRSWKLHALVSPVPRPRRLATSRRAWTILATIMRKTLLAGWTMRTLILPRIHSSQQLRVLRQQLDEVVLIRAEAWRPPLGPLVAAMSVRRLS